MRTPTYAVLRVPALAYMLVKAEIAKLPKNDYGHMIDREAGMPEMLRFDGIALEARSERVTRGGPNQEARDTDDARESRREALAAILELVAKEGLDGPRDLDGALDAILSVFGEEHGG